MAGVFILRPGLSYVDEAGQPDVMRGEETEIFGIADAGARLIVLPGSHSKWAKVDGDRIVGFKTFVTGELFAALRDHTVAGAFAKAAPAKSPGEAFALGVRRGAAAAACEGKSGRASASCLARDRCRSWAPCRRTTPANISPAS